MLYVRPLSYERGRIFMTDKFKACKEVLLIAQHRLIVGLVAFGLGIGLIASAYLRV